MRNFLVLILISGIVGLASAQDGSPQKYALLVAVREYEHPDMNQPLLQYPEVDAKSMQELLKESGYEVDLLIGKQATQANVRKNLTSFSEKGGNKGVVLVGIFGHGIEFESTKKSYFCPYDTSVKAKRDSQGRTIPDDSGKPRMEPVAEKMIAIDEILVALRESKATNRVLLADCCRNDPNAARGRSFGTSLGTNDLPLNTAVLFACSAQEKAFEHSDWGHGAFTKCLLDSIRSSAGRGKKLMGSIAEDVGESVEKIVKSKVSATQTPFLLSTGTRIDLQMATVPLRKGFEGSIAGEAKEVNGTVFHWCPPGSFEMGGNKVAATLSNGFWLGETEVTQDQWQKLMGTSPWSQKRNVKEGSDYPATYITHDDAVSFCDKLTTREQGANRLPKDWKYSLPTEAQWEYACRSVTKTKFSFGDDESNLGDYARYNSNSEGVDRVGQKKANPWGLKDIHGNVWEWCSDWYSDKLSGGRDPQGPATGSARVIRGGAWLSNATQCQSDHREGYSADFEYGDLGFRLAVIPGSSNGGINSQLTHQNESMTSRSLEGTNAGEAKNVNGIVFHWCPSGTFTMGASDKTNNESSVSVKLTSGFWLGETEVTEGQYKKLMDNGSMKGDDYPVTNVYHEDAVTYCQKLTSHERNANRLPKDWKYSLPTEAQWEYACRAGTKTKFSFSDDESKLGDYGWYYDNANSVNQVGQKPANKWGLRDMHGNVWEWCSDYYGDKLPGGQNPQGPASGSYRTIRGGGWFSAAAKCQSDYREGYFTQYSDLGFRLALVRE